MIDEDTSMSSAALELGDVERLLRELEAEDKFSGVVVITQGDQQLLPKAVPTFVSRGFRRGRLKLAPTWQGNGAVRRRAASSGSSARRKRR
jgi:hypothetical protein